MNAYLNQLEAAARAASFHSPTSYSWFGRRTLNIPPNVRRALTQRTARNYLLYDLQNQLYSNFYCKGYAAPAAQEPGGAFAGVAPFVERLSAANAGGGYWEGGWAVRQFVDGQVAVHRERLELHVRPEECLIETDDTLEPGRTLSLRFPKEFLGMSPGFYMALSDRPLAQTGAGNVVRLYWNLTAEGAVTFVRIATSLLNEARLPFKLKTINDPTRFVRRDAVVLYFDKNDYAAVAPVAARIYADVSAYIRPGVPALTKPLAAGVGLAEDPGGVESFGQHRCRILAEGLVRANERGVNSAAGRMEVVEECFAEEGIEIARPYLNPGSADDYAFEVAESRPAPAITAAPLPREHDAAAFLRVAQEIGEGIARNAVWHEGRCNWMGAVVKENLSQSHQAGVVYSALGPDLYSGSGGVALFLAELYAAAGGDAVRRTALGALRHALSAAETMPPPARLGFYTGGLGIAFAAARAGALLGEEELLERAARTARARLDEKGGGEYDLLSGNAGAVVALLLLRDMLADDSLLDSAVRLGDELLRTAVESDAGCSWRSNAAPRRPNLTGFSHGAAGVAYALLELFRSTGEAKYREAAERSFQYERRWFDADSGNWPNLCEESGRPGRGRKSFSFATHWCNGAPGIALSRLRAYEILGDDAYKAEAVTALRTTHRVTEALLHAGAEDFSLCHGLAGNAEVLLHGSALSGASEEGWATAPLQVAHAGIVKREAEGARWACGTGANASPSLFLGLAGVGHFYLRLHDREVPSVLLPRREAFRRGHAGDSGRAGVGVN